MKNFQKLDDFQKLSKDNLIEEMMKGTIKGGCCRRSGIDSTGNAIWDNNQ